jgi:8-oxo-dGTP pyrophosphatase MutT (NUDIX family)
MKLNQIRRTIFREQDEKLAAMSDEEFEEYVGKFPLEDQPHVRAQRETGYWGRTAAGGLFLARDTGRILFSHRSEDVLEPHTWGIYGGAINVGEDPESAAYREAEEEIGGAIPIEDIIPLYVFRHPSGFQYFNYLFIVPTEFGPRLTWETQGYDWVEFGDWPVPLHPGTALLLKDNRSARLIQRYSEQASGGEEERLNAALGTYKTIGNWEKGTQGFKKPADRRMITNPVIQDRARKKFASTDHPFNFYFINQPGVGQHMETGKVGRDWIDKNLPKAAAEIQHDNMGINIIFVGNQAGEWRPMTPWIMAHRIGHAFMPGGSPRDNSLWGMKEAHDALIRHTSYIMEAVYNRGDRPTKDADMRGRYGYGYDENRAKQNRLTQREFRVFWEHVGNFKSAREGNIRDWFEVINELLAQYLTTGQITFRPLPPSIRKRGAFNNPEIWMGAKEADLEWGNSAMEDMADEIRDYFDNALSEALGHYFVM